MERAGLNSRKWFCKTSLQNRINYVCENRREHIEGSQVTPVTVFTKAFLPDLPQEVVDSRKNRHPMARVCLPEEP